MGDIINQLMDIIVLDPKCDYMVIPIRSSGGICGLGFGGGKGGGGGVEGGLFKSLLSDRALNFMAVSASSRHI